MIEEGKVAALVLVQVQGGKRYFIVVKCRDSRGGERLQHLYLYKYKGEFFLFLYILSW